MRNPVITRGLVVVALIITFFPLVLALFRIWGDPDVPFLLPKGSAQWIEIERHWNLGMWKTNEHIVYRRQFTIKKPLPHANLTISALRSAEVYLDGRLVMLPNDMADWKHARTVDLSSLLGAGSHELRVDVSTQNGPALLLAYSDAVDVDSGTDWQASLDRVRWGPVSVAGKRLPAELSQSFPGSWSAFRALIPLYLPLFILSFFTLLFAEPALRQYPRLKEMISGPATIRWMLLGAWAVLAANNIFKLPLHVGFDSVFHREYIGYIVEKGAIPLASEGWQMFQSPLYYLASAPLSMFASAIFSGDKAEMMLRLIPLACGALQVETSFRAGKHVFPDRNDLQVMGTLIGGFAPMNFYISQVIGNEPLAGLLSSIAVVMVLGLISSDVVTLPKKKLLPLGIVLGLALLTKVTAVLLVPAVLLALISMQSRMKASAKTVVVACLAVLGIVVVVSGWYYFRNWIELGSPFVGGWETSRRIVWWQDPGYRTIRDFLSFGRSLVYPVYSGLAGFWDSVYSTFWLDGFLSSIISSDIRPPWNYDFMISGAMLSILPAAGILFGVVKTAYQHGIARPGQLFSAYCIVLFFSVLLYLYVTVPIYSTAKATYTIGIIPCYAIICVTGLDIVMKSRFMGAAVKALLICWAVSSYFSYFVL